VAVPGEVGSVSIDGIQWWVAREVTNTTGTYKMLVSKPPLASGVPFNPTQDSYYEGSNLQTTVTRLYEGMNAMKRIAVVPNLGNHAQTFLTQPTSELAGSQTLNIFFPLTHADAIGLGAQANHYGSSCWWTRSPYSAAEVYHITPYGSGGAATVSANSTKEDVVVGVWVKAV
jgi:hypothetical protein